jgi:signal transduction histidine kinase
MLEDTTLVHLEALRVSLHRLRIFPLPADTLAAVDEAIQKADRLAKHLVSKGGQNRLEALYRVSQVLGASLDLDEVLNQVMDAVIDLTGSERGFLMLLNPESGELDLRVARNIDHSALDNKELAISHTVIQSVIQNGTGIISTDAQRDPRFATQDSIVFFALRSIMCTPLRARGQVIGVIYVDNRAQVGVFTMEDLDLLNAFAAQAAISIENARLYTRTDKALAARVAELEILSRVDQELTAKLDYDRVIERTRYWAAQQTGAHRCYLIRQEEDGTLRQLGESEDDGTPTLHNTLVQAVRSAFESGKPLNYPAEGNSPSRMIVPVGETNIALVVESRGVFEAGATQFLGHLAARAAVALENARLYQAVQEANIAKTKFVSVVTHELRIPMTSIKGYSDLIRTGTVGPINEMQANFLNIIRNNVERMNALVSDLSDISHIENGRLKLNSSYLPLNDLIQETVSNIQHRMEEKKQTLTLEVSPDLPQVFGDPNRLVQVMTNLLNNANKYTPEGGKVWLRAMQSGNFVRIEVQDNGIGISEEDQKSLFTQFFRSENQAVRDQQGWGLGLNLARRLVDMMGGEMGMESELDQGSTFWFTVPLQSPAAN